MNHVLATRLSQIISANKSPSLRTVQSLLTASQQVAKGAQQVRVYLSGSWVVLTAKMAVEEALKVLELSAADARDAAKLKTAYRTASRKHHPDTGGDPEMMKKVNEAMEVLEKNAVNFKGPKNYMDLTEEERKAADMAQGARGEAIVNNVLKQNFKPEAFTAHFEKVWGEKFNYSQKEKQYKTMWGGPKAIDIYSEWVSEDGETIFSLKMYADYFMVSSATSLGGGDSDDNMVFSLGLTQEIISHGRKTKFKPRAWMSSSRVSNIMDPEALFPAAKIKKMKAGGDKKRVFSKRDMILGIEKYLGGTTPVTGSKEQLAIIPLGKEFMHPGWEGKAPKFESFPFTSISTWHRVAFVHNGQKGATWSLIRVDGPYVPKEGRARANNVKFISFTESDELLAAMRKMQKACASLDDPDTIASVVVRHMEALRAGGEAEPEVEVKKKPVPAPIDFGMWASVGPVVRNHIVHAMAAFEEARLLEAKIKH